RIVLARRSRRPAGQTLEDAGEVALVRETGLDRDLRERPLLAEQLLGPPHATLGHVHPRRHPLDLAEDALEVRRRERDLPGDRLDVQRSAQVLVDEALGRLDRLSPAMAAPNW